MRRFNLIAVHVEKKVKLLVNYKYFMSNSMIEQQLLLPFPAETYCILPLAQVKQTNQPKM